MSRLLHPIAMPCRRGVMTLNLTRGCLHRCLYCYASAYRAAPPPGTTALYPQLIPRLRAELSRRRLPAFVQLSTTSDLFQPAPEVRRVAGEALSLLLERGVGVSFLTKGLIPEPCYSLFRRFPGRVYATIGLVSLDPRFHRLWEPGTAPPELRLENIERLGEAGVPVEVRLDPVIPGLSDGEEELDSLFSAVARRGVSQVVVSFLLLRPGVARRLWEGLPPALERRLFSFYRGSCYVAVGASRTTRLPSVEWRREMCGRISQIARGYGVRTRLCACKNPDTGGDLCHAGVDGFFSGLSLMKPPDRAEAVGVTRCGR